MIAWIYLRHYLNLRILWSHFTEFEPVGPFELDWETQQYKCWISQYISASLLASLQGLNIFWLYYIFRVAYRFVFLHALQDDRSDNDEAELAEEERLNPLVKEDVDKNTGPTVLLNGQAMNGHVTAVELNTDKVAKKKGRKS